MTNTKKYCVYQTIYNGDKLPQNYIGSSTVENVLKGYHGSVKSKVYKSTWKLELKQNPHLFSTEIISYHDTRPEATYKELQLQKLFNVVKNPLFINMSYAKPNGFFGRNISGKNNPNYNNKWDQSQKTKASNIHKEIHSYKGKSIFVSNNTIKKSYQIPEKLLPEYIDQGWILGRVYMNTKTISEKMKISAINKNSIFCSCLICKNKIQAHLLNRHINLHKTGIEYFGEIYTSYTELYKKTKCSSELYKKYYLNNIDPRPRIGSNGPIKK